MTFRTWREHFLNPLHVYCRLRDFGLSKGLAVRLSKFYEKIKSAFTEFIKRGWRR